jgi:hypothetical protein
MKLLPKSTISWCVAAFCLALSLFILWQKTAIDSVTHTTRNTTVVDTSDRDNASSSGDERFAIRPEKKLPIVERLSALLDNCDKGIDLGELDKITLEFLETSKLTREEKINFLLSRAFLNPAIFGHAEQICCELLAAMQAIECAPRIIEAFHKSELDSARIAILNLLRNASISQSPPDNTDSKRIADLHANIPLVTSFLADIIKSANNVILVDALRAYCDISPPEVSAQMSVDLMHKWIESAYKNALTENDVSHINLLQQVVSSGLATPSTQNQVFPLLTEWLGQFDTGDLSDFHEYLYRVASSADLTETAQKHLSLYLQEKKPDPAPSSTFFHWADATARVSGGADPNARLSMIADRARQSSSPLDTASILVYGPSELLNSYSGAELAQIKGNLRDYALTAEGESTEIAKSAVEVIDEYLAGRATPTPQLQK